VSRKLTSVSLLGLSLATGACAAETCTNSVVDQKAAPSGALRAVIFQRDCGATTGFSTQVSILAVDQPLADADAGNAFIADGDHGTAAAPWGGPWAEARWTSPSTLLIRYDAAARVFSSETRVGSVTVTFEPVRTASLAR
jgi:hypothetical protein